VDWSLVRSPHFRRIRILVHAVRVGRSKRHDNRHEVTTQESFGEVVRRFCGKWFQQCATLSVVEFGEVDFRWMDERVMESFVRPVTAIPSLHMDTIGDDNLVEEKTD
jgi:hypothetical protein